MLKSIYTPSEFAMGFTEGKSIISNAQIHKKQNYVLNLDLKDFFPSIEQARVWKRLQIPPFSFPAPIANIIAGLVSMKVSNSKTTNTSKSKTTHTSNNNTTNTTSYKYVLPQGSPTSPIITNMICDKLDYRLSHLAKRFKLNYSRYADDITFSSMHNVYQPNGEFYKELYKIIEGQGFTVNEEKTRLQKRGSKQEVTGIIVNDKLNVARKYVRDIRNILYIWDRYGISVAYIKFFSKYKEEKGHVKKDFPNIVDVLKGKLLYLKMVKGENDSTYISLNNKFNFLLEKTFSKEKTNEFCITYADTTPIALFEKRNNTKINFSQTKVIDFDYEMYEIMGIEANQKEIKKFKKRYAYFTINNKNIYALVDKTINIGEQIKEKLAISYCRDRKNKTFWLIHDINKTTVPRKKYRGNAIEKGYKKVDINNLNKDLDSLLNIQYG
jgi:Reverse transcriptase (RNA-dependent DNA polymerase).